ncbi:MAG: BatA domain-containing protein, partial [Bacteroidales bacterium]|nr:BatA domain-containing protein [Bacteroidales bacterium]
MQFLSPLFLIGLAAVAIPIVVHLFNFRRYKKVYFSNVELLRQLESETQKQSKLKQLLVLALRIMCIIFIVLAFAQPIIPTDKSRAIAVGNQYVSVYIDNSFSMEATTADG